MVKLTPAQHLVYRHLLVIQDRKLADAIRVEGQKHDGVGAVRGGDGGPMSPGRAVAGESCGGDANGEGGEDEVAAVVAKRDDVHYQKLMTLLVHLRWVGGKVGGVAVVADRTGANLAVEAVSRGCTRKRKRPWKEEDFCNAEDVFFSSGTLAGRKEMLFPRLQLLMSSGWYTLRIYEICNIS